jgi:hypothetical protein
MRKALALLAVLLLSGCFTDPATRLAADLQSGARKLGSAEGARHTFRHQMPSARGQCEGPYRVQFDKVGALIIWCRNDSGETVSSHSTSSHGRKVHINETLILDKPAGSALEIVLTRQSGAAVIVTVQ